jgi:hypothetical protein
MKDFERAGEGKGLTESEAKELKKQLKELDKL